MTHRETVADIGERALLARLHPWIVSGEKGGIFGVGDDCAVVPSPGTGDKLILTSDLLLENTHFLNNGRTNWRFVGMKAMAANISDIAAMGGEPTGVLISLGLPGNMSIKDVLDLYRGFYTVAVNYNAPIIGGDIARASVVTIGITVQGRKGAGTASCLRSDARPGDYLYVSGPLGASRAGLEVILHDAKYAAIPPELKSALIDKHFCPRPQVGLGRWIAETHDRAAMIDISDGLWNEAALIAEASGVRLDIELTSIPVETETTEFCRLTDTSAQEFALFSGEEYELLFSVAESPEELSQRMVGCGLSTGPVCIGRVTEGSGVAVCHNGKPVAVTNQTFSHFQ